MKFINTMNTTENEVVVSKLRYNERVATFNKYYKSFPYVFVARATGFEEKKYFKEVSEE